MPVDDDGLCGQTKKETSPALLGYHGKVERVSNAAVSEAEQKKTMHQFIVEPAKAKVEKTNGSRKRSDGGANGRKGQAQQWHKL